MDFAAFFSLPPHANYSWTPFTFWLDIITTAVVALAEVTTAVLLIWFVKKRPSTPFAWLTQMFGLFILTRGGVQLLHIINLWINSQELQDIGKCFSAVFATIVVYGLVKNYKEMLAAPNIIELQEKIDKETLLFKAIVDTSPTMIYAKDRAGRILIANKTVVDHVGKPLDQIIGKTTAEYYDNAAFTPDKLATIQSVDEQVMTDRAPISYKESIDDLHMLIVKAPIIKDDKVIGIVGINTDISDLVNLNKTLEEKVNQRTEQLMQSNLELEKFSYTVAHDLRAPLRAINGFSDALTEDYGDKIPPEGLRYLSRIRAAAERMGYLIDDLLKLSRLTGAKLRLVPVNLTRLAQQVVETLKANQPDRPVQVIIKPGMTANVDQDFFKIALENLFDNAFKYTSKQTYPVIEFGQRSDGVYFIKDNGAGFDMAHADKLFGAFQRLHTQDEFPGNGIGLATVQRVINKHGGKIWAEALPNVGATFFFRIGEPL